MKNTCHLAPNGKASSVYSELAENFGHDFAENAFLQINSQDFRTKFGDWRNHADEMIDKTPGTIQYEMAKARSFRDKVVNEKTLEPKVFYYSGKRTMVANDFRDSMVINKFKDLLKAFHDLRFEKSFYEKLSMDDIFDSELKEESKNLNNVFNDKQIFNSTGSLINNLKELKKSFDKALNYADEGTKENIYKYYEELFQSLSDQKTLDNFLKEPKEVVTYNEKNYEYVTEPLKLILNRYIDNAKSVFNMMTSNTDGMFELSYELYLALEQMMLESEYTKAAFELSTEYTPGSIPVFYSNNNIGKGSLIEGLRNNADGVIDPTNPTRIHIFDADSIIKVGDTEDTLDLYSPYTEEILKSVTQDTIIDNVNNELGGNYLKVDNKSRSAVSFDSDLSVSVNLDKTNATTDFKAFTENLRRAGAIAKVMKDFKSDSDAIRTLLNTFKDDTKAGDNTIQSSYQQLNTFLGLDSMDPVQALSTLLLNNFNNLGSDIVYHLGGDEAITNEVIDYVFKPFKTIEEIDSNIRLGNTVSKIKIDGNTLNEFIYTNDDIEEVKELKELETTINSRGILGAPTSDTNIEGTIKSEMMDVIEFVDSLKLDTSGNPILNPLTGRPEINHFYRNKKSGEITERSITSIKKDYSEFNFDSSKVLSNYVVHDKYSREIFTVLDKNGVEDATATKLKIARFIGAIHLQDSKEYFNKFPLELEKFSKLEDKEKNKYLYSLTKSWYQTTEEARRWALTAEAGTELHRIMEAVLREDADLTSEDKVILMKESALEKELNAINKEYQEVIEGNPRMLAKFLPKVAERVALVDKAKAEGGNVKAAEDNLQAYIGELKVHFLDEVKNIAPDLIKILDKGEQYNKRKIIYTGDDSVSKNNLVANFVKNRSSLLPDNYDSNNEYADIFNHFVNKAVSIHSKYNIYKGAKTIKDVIKSRGGKILTEVNVYTKNVNEIDDSGKFFTAGQIDILAVYEDDPSVDEEYRGTVEIYDLKTMSKGAFSDVPNYYTMEGNKFKGYAPYKQAEHSFQLLMYSAILERELGLKVKDAFVVPVNAPSVNPSTGQFQGRFNFVDFSSHGRHKKGQVPYAVNINTFNGIKGNSLLGIQDVSSYKDNANRVNQRIPREGEYFVDGKRIEEGEKIRRAINEKRNNEALQKAINKVTIFIDSEIKRLRRVKKDERTIAQEAKLLKLQNELEEAEGMGKLIKFIADAHADIVGEEVNGKKIIGLHEQFYSIVDAFLDPSQTVSIGETIRQMDDIRIYAQNYEVLNKIKKVLDKAPTKERNAILDSEEYQKLQEAISQKDAILEDVYDYSKRMIAKRIAPFISTNATLEAKQHFKFNEVRTKEKIKNAEARLEELKKSGASQKSIVSAKRRIQNLKKVLQKDAVKLDDLTINENTIAESLTQLPVDIGWISKMFLSPISSSDSIMALFAKMTKFELSTAEYKLKKDAVEFENFLEDFKKQMNLGKVGITNKVDEFFDPILEERYKWKFNPETGKMEFVNTIGLLDEYDTVGTIEVTDPETGEVQVVEVDYKEMDRHYRYRMNEAKKENDGKGNWKKFRKIFKEYQEWLKENFELPYTSEYYELENILSDDTAALIDSINEEITQIKDNSEAGNMFLTDDEVNEIKKLQIRKKELASVFNSKGEYKEDPVEIRMAQELTRYNEKFQELHDFSSNDALFEMKKKEARNKFRDSPIDYLKWLTSNQQVSLTSEFYEDYNKLKYIRKVRYSVVDAKLPEGFLEEISEYLDYYEDYSYEEIFEKVEEAVKRYDFNLDTRGDLSLEGLYETLNELVTPYRLDGSYNIDLIPDEVKAQILEIESEIDDILQLRALEAEAGVSKADFEFNANKNREWAKYTSKINEIVKFRTTNDYELTRALEEEKHMERMLKLPSDKRINFTSSEWYQNNHVGIKPLRIWTQMYPANYVPTISNSYELDKQMELRRIAREFPELSEAGQLLKLHKTKWFKRFHVKDRVEETFNLSPLGERMYLEPKENKYIKIKPGPRFNKVTVKEEYTIPTTSDIYDRFGKLKPKKGKWENKKLANLKGPMKELHSRLSTMYREAQERLPEAHQMGNTLPFYRKSTVDRLAAQEGNVFTKGLNVLKDLKENNITSNASLDAEEEGIDDEGVTRSNTTIDEKFIPMFGTTFQSTEDTSRDAISSVLKFVKQSYKHEALSNLLGEARSIAALINHREGPEGEGTVERTADGKKIYDRLADNLGIKELKRKSGMSQSSQLFLNFLDMHFFNEMNIPSEATIPGTTRTIRVDKMADSMMTLASITQIGGLNLVGAMKGTANLLQAEVQFQIEKFGGSHFGAAQWKAATSLANFKNIVADAVSDFGKSTRTSYAGQLFDIYDPLQGEFFDDYGNAVSQKTLSRLFSWNTWFFNQYVGEYKIAMTSLFATLRSYKVDESGEVYNEKDYLSKKAADKNLFLKEKDGSFTLVDGKKVGDWSQLSELEVIDAKAEHAAMTNTLMDNIYKDPKDNQLKIKEGVNWQFGSFRDNQMKFKLHAINKQLHGAYGKLDKPVVERHWGGRLLTMYKKFFVPAIRRRYGAMQRDEELDSIHIGYYRQFINLLAKDHRRLLTNLINIMFNRRTETGFSELEKASVRKTLAEVNVMIGLAALVFLLKPGEDDDKEEISGVRYFALYELLRLRREMTALAPTPLALGDNWKLLKSPSALVGFSDRFMNFLFQWAAPAEVYKQDSGIAEKGDLKLWIKFRKLLGTFSLPMMENATVRQSYENLTKHF